MSRTEDHEIVVNSVFNPKDLLFKISHDMTRVFDDPRHALGQFRH